MPDTGQQKVLVVNAGSSSVKYRLLSMAPERTLAGGLFENIGAAGSRLVQRVGDDAAPSVHELPARDHRAALAHIGAALRATHLLADGERLTAIGHRVVHGGETFAAPTRIDAAVLERIRALSTLAPLHNPANVLGIEVCLAAFPQVPQVAVFDTAFHQTMPPVAFRYALPEDWYQHYGVRRYGFHGSSHRYVAGRAALHLGRPLESLNLISLHLGNGASACAIRAGRSVDTSMGFTPLEGLVMGTRSGDIDPAIPLYVQGAAGLERAEVERLLNQESGLRGLAGTNDLRELLARDAAGDASATAALELYTYRIRKYIGAYLAALGRADALVFTGGVGENASEVRLRTCAGLEGFGIVLDAQANRAAGGEIAEIGRPEAGVRVLVIRTDEELQIAREALAVAMA